MPTSTIQFWKDLGVRVRDREDIPPWAIYYIESVPTHELAGWVDAGRWRIRPYDMIRYIAGAFADAALATFHPKQPEWMLRIVKETYESEHDRACPFIIEADP